MGKPPRAAVAQVSGAPLRIHMVESRPRARQIELQSAISLKAQQKRTRLVRCQAVLELEPLRKQCHSRKKRHLKWYKRRRWSSAGGSALRESSRPLNTATTNSSSFMSAHLMPYSTLKSWASVVCYPRKLR